jgi:phosphoribosylformimino-5-aminoimidazole carboxamide ribotide isomerase
VEGLCQGIDEDLVASTSVQLSRYRFLVLKPRVELGEWVGVPTTYAGGAKGRLSLVLWGCVARLTDPLSADISDLDLVDRLSEGRVDLTYGR